MSPGPNTSDPMLPYYSVKTQRRVAVREANYIASEKARQLNTETANQNLSRDFDNWSFVGACIVGGIAGVVAFGIALVAVPSTIAALMIGGAVAVGAGFTTSVLTTSARAVVSEGVDAWSEAPDQIRAGFPLIQ